MKEQIVNEIEQLCSEGLSILKKFKNDVPKDRLNIQAKYQQWFSKSLNVVKIFLPARYQEFYECYKLDKRKEVEYSTYRIYDYFIGVELHILESTLGVASLQFFTQVTILESIRDNINNILFNISENIELEIMDNELLSTKKLFKKGFYRSAGAICGVLLEKHFSSILLAHGVTIKKKDPCISDYNDLLKAEGIYDTVNWRFIQHLGDIRNLCDHNKDRNPTKEEVEELINGTDKVIKTIF